MDSWYHTDNLIEGQRQYRSYELGALRGHMEIPKDDLSDDYPYTRYRPYAADVPGEKMLRVIVNARDVPVPIDCSDQLCNAPTVDMDIPGVGKMIGTTREDYGPLDWNEVKAANPWYFEALKQAAAIMPMRRAKYSGEDPFDNFEKVGRITGTSAAEAFRFDIALKLARLQVGAGDFDDESFNDCLKDLANYALLWCGYRLMEAEKQTSP